MNYDRSELERALSVYEKAKDEARKAADEATSAVEDKKALLATIGQDLPLKERVSKRMAMKDAIAKADKRSAEKKRAERITAAVLRVAGKNVANAAANLLMKALSENEKMANTPPHYKKFKDFVATVFGPYAADFPVYGEHGLNVMFRPAESGHDMATVFLKGDNEQKPVFTLIASYEMIKDEVERVSAYALKLEESLNELRRQEKTEREKYQTEAMHLLPSIASNAVYETFKFY